MTELRTHCARYGGALAIVTAAIAVRWLLIPWLQTDVPYATLLGAIAVVVWMGGWGPALAGAIYGFIGIGLVVGRPLGKRCAGLGMPTAARRSASSGPRRRQFKAMPS